MRKCTICGGDTHWSRPTCRRCRGLPPLPSKQTLPKPIRPQTMRVRSAHSRVYDDAWARVLTALDDLEKVGINIEIIELFKSNINNNRRNQIPYPAVIHIVPTDEFYAVWGKTQHALSVLIFSITNKKDEYKRIPIGIFIEHINSKLR